MAAERANDLRAFLEFADSKLSDGSRLTLDEAISLWDAENASADERSAAEALKEALADMRAGDVGVPAREFLAEMRRKSLRIR